MLFLEIGLLNVDTPSFSFNLTVHDRIMPVRMGDIHPKYPLYFENHPLAVAWSLVQRV